MLLQQLRSQRQEERILRTLLSQQGRRRRLCAGLVAGLLLGDGLMEVAEVERRQRTCASLPKFGKFGDTSRNPMCNSQSGLKHSKLARCIAYGVLEFPQMLAAYLAWMERFKSDVRSAASWITARSRPASYACEPSCTESRAAPTADALLPAGERQISPVPGLVETVRAPGTKPPQHHQVNKTLTGRFTTPQEIAAAVRLPRRTFGALHHRPVPARPCWRILWIGAAWQLHC